MNEWQIVLAVLLFANGAWATYRRDTVGTAISLVGLVLLLP